MIGEDGKTVPAARGYWRANGYGHLFEVPDTGINPYSETENNVWKQANHEYADPWVKLDETQNVASISEHDVYVDHPSRDHAVTYIKPIYLVTSDITVSAVEIFVLCMKDLSHVTTVGTRTRQRPVRFPQQDIADRWNFGLSNEIYHHSQGIRDEVTDIPPNVPKTILNRAKPDAGHATAILEIAKSIKQ